jgi:hypothetical protein
MNQTIKQRLIRALESGFYSQTQTNLKDEIGYCALGVLCDLYSMDTGVPWKANLSFYSIAGQSTTIPQAVRLWAEIDSSIEDNLMGMNDANITFLGIANYLKNA